MSLLTQSRRVTRAGKCPLIGAKQTWHRHRGMSVVDPKRTLTLPKLPSCIWLWSYSWPLREVVCPRHLPPCLRRSRMKTCLDQYRTNKANNPNGGLKWIQKGGGYYSECIKRRKGQA